MSLDPEIAQVLASLGDRKPLEEMTLEEIRASAIPLPFDRRPAVGSIEDRVAAGVPVRVYQPKERQCRVLVLYFHGGGFVIGDLETHDHVARDICNAAGCVVVSVDYRRAPEHKFPKPTDDCLATAHWAAANAEALGASPDLIVLAGDSAGAALATVTAMRLRDEGGPVPAGQMLAYPVTDYHTPPTRSYVDFATGYSLTRTAMIYFWREYLETEADADNPHASPLRAPDLSRMPPTLLLTAGYDPLRDEGDAYAARLAEAGVPVDHRRYGDLIHGFLRLSPVSSAARSIVADVGEWIKAIDPAASR
jgi:acetyl esterase